MKHFPHATYTSEEILKTLISLINEGFAALGCDGTTGKKIVEAFWGTVADFYIDPESSFVHFKARSNTVNPHPFQSKFFTNRTRA